MSFQAYLASYTSGSESDRWNNNITIPYDYLQLVIIWQDFATVVVKENPVTKKPDDTLGSM